jgi:hypothetical protein|tara:strand:- start:65728 stop:65832 length:105 start_codon:yes stop_codon:yes gene_type:complete
MAVFVCHNGYSAILADKKTPSVKKAFLKFMMKKI